MSPDRIAVLQENIDDLYKQLSGQEKGLILAEEADKKRHELKIRETWKLIRGFEKEYAQRIIQKVRQENLEEQLAEEVTVELVNEIEMLEPLEERDEVRVLLQEILAELRKQEIPASAKLKVALPIVPSIVSYELEGDTESIIRQLFPTFEKVYSGVKALASKKP